MRTADEVAPPLPQSLKPGGAVARPVIYGIRPEHFRLSADGKHSMVSLIEPNGSETQVTARLAGMPIICAFHERVAARPGETIAVDPASVHLSVRRRQSSADGAQLTAEGHGRVAPE